MSYLGDTPETYFKQAQLIHWLALPEDYSEPSPESALAQKLGVNRSRARVRSSRGLGFRAKASTLLLGFQPASCGFFLLGGRPLPRYSATFAHTSTIASSYPPHPSETKGGGECRCPRCSLS
jgi:hypothetical protein